MTRLPNPPLLLLASLCVAPMLLSACQGDTPATPNDAAVQCETQGFRLTALHVPTHEDVTAGTPVGHDLDGVGQVCNYPDYDGGVDNALLDVAAAYPELMPGSPGLQEMIDAGLFCTAQDSDCEGVSFEIQLTRCGAGTSVRVLEVSSAGEVEVGSAETVSLSMTGELRAEFSAFNFNVPVAAQELRLRLPLLLERAILTGTVTDTTITNIVLGGVLPRDQVTGGDAPFTPFAPTEPVGQLFDVESLTAPGVCDGFSVGFRAAVAER